MPVQGLLILPFRRWNSTFKRRFLLNLSTKSWFQILLECGNKSRRWRNQEIQTLRCINSLIARNIQEYISRRRERISNVLILGSKRTMESKEANFYGFVATFGSSLERQDHATWLREERASWDLVCLIVNGRFKFLDDALNPGSYNSSN